MAAAQLKQHVESLMAKVRQNHVTWQQYLQSVDATLAPFLSTTRWLPITTRIHNINRALASLEARRQILSSLEATDMTPIPTALLLIITAPTDTRGTDTLLSIIRRKVEMTEIGLRAIKGEIEAGERLVSARFNQLRSNYDDLMELFDACSEKYDKALEVLKVHERVESALYYGGVAIEDEEKYASIEHAKGGCYKFVRMFERWILRFKRNLGLVGMYVARQTMITEYYT